MIAIVIALTGLYSPPPSGTPFVDEIVRVGCNGNYPDRSMVETLLEIEEEAGFSGQARGLLVAAACAESGFNPAKKGDWRPKGCRRRVEETCEARAVGLVQFWWWARKGVQRYGATTLEPREDWEASARYWAAHVVAQFPAVDRDCDHSLPYDRWHAAHRTAVVKPKCVRRRGKRCIKRMARCYVPGAKSLHWRVLESWKGDRRAVN